MAVGVNEFWSSKLIPITNFMDEFIFFSIAIIPPETRIDARTAIKPLAKFEMYRN